MKPVVGRTGAVTLALVFVVAGCSGGGLFKPSTPGGTLMLTCASRNLTSGQLTVEVACRGATRSGWATTMTLTTSMLSPGSVSSRSSNNSVVEVATSNSNTFSARPKSRGRATVSIRDDRGDDVEIEEEVEERAETPEPENESKFEFGLVRIADLESKSRAAFPGASVGMDPLARGQVEVKEHERNEVEAEVRGAQPNATYAVDFCPFAGGPSGCSSAASLNTNGNGEGKAEFAFPSTGAFAGVFVLERSSKKQFVTGFTVAATISHESGEEGKAEASLVPVGLVSGGVGFGTAGDDSLARGSVELKEDGRVEIEVAGAAANAMYAAKFCRFGGTSSDCLGLGSVATNVQGNAEARLTFPQTGTFDGVFLLTRQVGSPAQETNEFVTGFRVP